MLILVNREQIVEELRKKELPFKSEEFLFTGRTQVYTWFEGRKNYGATLYNVPNKTFGLGFIDQFVLTNEPTLMKLYQVINSGVIFNWTMPWSIENYFYSITKVRAALEKDEAIKVKRAKMEDDHKAKVELWREALKEIKEANKKLKEEYKVALKDAPESVKQYLKEPEYQEEPLRPVEPTLPEYEKGSSIHSERLDANSAWRLFQRFELYRINGTDFGFLKKRSEFLQFNTRNVLSLKVEEMEKDDFYEFIKNNDIDIEKKVFDIKQSFYDSDCWDLVSTSDNSIQNLRFSEENGFEEIKLPVLAPIKPMHAASMLAGGIGAYSKEISLKGEPYIIKAAMVKEFHQRKTIFDGKEVEEVVECWEQKMGVYNILRRDLKIM